MNTEGILLAAGLSSRCSQYKLALDFRGKTVLERCMESMYDYCSSINVVTGYNAGKITGLCSGYAKARAVFNPDYESGMFGSIKLGLKNITASRFFLVPGDCPLIPGSVYQAMLETGSDILVPVCNGRRGHPLLMNSRFIDEILNGSWVNMQDFIGSRGCETMETEEPGILIDIDSEEDYLCALNYYDTCYNRSR